MINIQICLPWPLGLGMSGHSWTSHLPGPVLCFMKPSLRSAWAASTVSVATPPKFAACRAPWLLSLSFMLRVRMGDTSHSSVQAAACVSSSFLLRSLMPQYLQFFQSSEWLRSVPGMGCTCCCHAEGTLQTHYPLSARQHPNNASTGFSQLCFEDTKCGFRHLLLWISKEKEACPALSRRHRDFRWSSAPGLYPCWTWAWPLPQLLLVLLWASPLSQTALQCLQSTAVNVQPLDFWGEEGPDGVLEIRTESLVWFGAS